MGGLVTFGTARAGCGPAKSPPHCTKCNSPPINASVPITVLLYDGLLLYGFNVAIKGLRSHFATYSSSCGCCKSNQSVAVTWFHCRCERFDSVTTALQHGGNSPRSPSLSC